MSIMKRSFVYATRFFAVIGLLAVLFAAWGFYLRESTLSLWWHMTHKNKVTFQGHKMTLPLMWRVEQRREGPGLYLSRAVNGQLYGWSLSIVSPSPDGKGVMDDASALDWQAKTVAFESRIKRLHVSTEVLHSKSLTFYCVDSDDAYLLIEAIDCKAVGTDWLVGSFVERKGLQEAREILRSLE